MTYASDKPPARLHLRVAGAAVVGRRHEKAGVPCGDAVRTFCNDRFACIALADGVGSANRGEEGARIAASCLATLMRDGFSELVEASEELCKNQIAVTLLRSLSRKAKQLGVEPDALATTLLFVATDGERFLAGQLGDGRVGMRLGSRATWALALTPDRSDFRNFTHVATDPSHWEAFCLARGTVPPYSAFVLMSDGAEEALYNRALDRFAPAITTVADWTTRVSRRRASAALAENLRDVVRERTFDDVGLAILSVGR